MYCVTITMNNAPIQFRYVYKNKDDGVKAYEAASQSMDFIDISDDWGQKGVFAVGTVNITANDLETGVELQIELEILNHKARSKLESKLKTSGIAIPTRPGPWDGLPKGSNTGGFRA